MSAKIYILHDLLEKHDVVFKRRGSKTQEPKKSFREILVIDNDCLYAIDPEAKNLKYIYKQILPNKALTSWESPAVLEKALASWESLSEWDKERIPSIKLSEIKKVKYRPEFEPVIAFGIADGYLYDTEVKFYRAVHHDTAPKLSISSLWLIEPEITKIIAPYMTAPGIMTDFKKEGDYLIQRRPNKERPFQDKLGHVYISFEWDSQDGRWVLAK